MAQSTKFFAKLFRVDAGGELELHSSLETLSEDLAVYAAKTGAISRAGAAVLAIRAEDPGHVAVLRTYGAVPKRAILCDIRDIMQVGSTH